MSEPHGADHDPMEFLGLLSGEANRGVALAMAERLRSCDACRRELADLLVAHAALASASRTLAEPADPAEVLAPLPTPDDVLPPPRPTPTRSHSWTIRWAVAAAAIVVAVVGVSTGLARSHQHPTVVAQAALRPLDGPANATGTLTALATGTDRELTVHTSALHAPGAQSFYEVWLLDPSTLKMLAVGVLPASGTGSYNMDASLMKGYSAVDISLQVNDGDPQHSKVSVLRGYF
jgi:anti-sigma factor RsiW